MDDGEKKSLNILPIAGLVAVLLILIVLIFLIKGCTNTKKKESKNDNKTEEEEKYVIIGSGSEKKALIESVEVPKITGAVILCSGGESAYVREQLYKAVSAALDLPTARIYVTKLR